MWWSSHRSRRTRCTACRKLAARRTHQRTLSSGSSPANSRFTQQFSCSRQNPGGRSFKPRRAPPPLAEDLGDIFPVTPARFPAQYAISTAYAGPNPMTPARLCVHCKSPLQGEGDDVVCVRCALTWAEGADEASTTSSSCDCLDVGGQGKLDRRAPAKLSIKKALSINRGLPNRRGL
jgi:hypothetical protein